MSQFGVGLRTKHYPKLEEQPQTKLDWFEVVSENHMNSQGRPWAILEKMRENYPVAFHGVSLNIGVNKEINLNYLTKLKEMIEVFDPMIVSDHLCWTGLPASNIHNLLPLPYNDESIHMVCTKMDKVQSFLGREIALENLSAYFEFKNSTYSEWEFLNLVAKKSGCKLLLDINNVYVNSQNLGFNPKDFIDSIPPEKVAQIHLAGFTNMGDFLFDTHSKPVYPEVWELFRHAIKNLKDVPVLIEWDEDIPEFEVLEDEAMKAKKIWGEVHGPKN